MLNVTCYTLNIPCYSARLITSYTELLHILLPVTCYMLTMDLDDDLDTDGYVTEASQLLPPLIKLDPKTIQPDARE